MFREDKSTQIAAYLIKKSGGRCNYLTLIKMMYDADREMVLRWGMPITFDSWVAMERGPVLSSTYDEINPKRPTSEYWGSHIATDGYDVVLKADPGDDALSDAELQMADKGYEDFRDLDYKQAITHAHNIFPEWTDPGLTSIPISYEDVLRANGQNSPEYFEEVRTHCQLNALYAR